ncbi:MAG: DNA mismatch repair protein MutS, partial [Proteobacteria bacterium]|nr:DNA mismatch repair protein MutS [Pseudomonadota bacterium]
MARRKDRGLSKEDLRIWRAVAQSVAPLPGKVVPPDPDPDVPAAAPVEGKAAARPRPPAVAVPA